MRVLRAVVLVPMLALPVACGSSSEAGSSGAAVTTGNPQGSATGRPQGSTTGSPQGSTTDSPQASSTGATATGGQTGTGGSSTGGATSGSSSGGMGSGAGSVAGPASLTFNVAFAGYAYVLPMYLGGSADGGDGLVLALSEQDLTSQCAPNATINMQSKKRLVCFMTTAGEDNSFALSPTGSFTAGSQDFQQYYTDDWGPGTGLYVDVGLGGPIMQLATATSGMFNFSDVIAPLTGSFTAQMVDPSQKSLGQLTGNFTASYCPALAYGCILPNPN